MESVTKNVAEQAEGKNLQETGKSLWHQTLKIPERESLQGDLQVENLVIGAGMAGILTAYLLQKKGRRVVVVEAKRVASGQTGNTTAKITCQHGLFYDKLMHKVSIGKAQQYIEANKDAMEKYERIIEEESIDCHLEYVPSFLYTTREEGISELRREAEAAKGLGVEARFVKGSRITELPFEVRAAVRFAGQMQFHPLEFLKALAQKLTIYENTKVLEVREHIAITNRGKIKAENIIFATHYPFVNAPGFYFLRQHQERSYVLALKQMHQMKEHESMYYSIDTGGLSLRSYENLLLLGGGSHRTGKGVDVYRECCKDSEKGYAYLRKAAKKYFPEYEEVAAWAAQDCMPHDGVPFIGGYSLFRPYWYVATGFHKWGMTSSMIAAMIISSKICREEVAYERVFSPCRFFLQASWKNLLLDIGESVKGLWKGIFGEEEHRCPHLGCALEWNEEEQSWDCPCHGSRFSKEGQIIDNPAQKDI